MMSIGISMEVRGSMKQFLKLTPEFVEYELLHDGISAVRSKALCNWR